MLYDISKEGRVLLGIDRSRMMVSASADSEPEHDVSWFDWSHVQAISRQGRYMLFDETGAGGGPNHSVYLRDTRTGSNVRLGDGQAVALSPDLKWALSLDSRRPGTLNLLPLSGEAPRTLSGRGIEYSWARYFPDGRSLLVGGHAPGKPLRLFLQPVSGGTRMPARIARVDISRSSASPWKELAPAEKAGLSYVMNVTMTPDGQSWAYSYLREWSELYVVDGWS